MYHLFPPYKNPRSHQPISVPAGVLTVPLSVLGVCDFWCITITSAITPIPSLMFVVSTCPLIIHVSSPVYIPSTAPTVLLMSLPSVYVIYSLAITIYISSEVPNLVY